MKKVSKLMNLEAISITNAVPLGYINAVIIENNSIIALNTNKGYSIPTSGILSVDEVITCNSYTDNEYSGRVLTGIGGNIVSTKGKKLGVIADYEYKNDFSLYRILSYEKSFSPNKIVSASEDILVMNMSSVKTVIKPLITSQPTIISDYSFLINRRLNRNVLTRDKKMLFPCNTVITKDIVEKARQYGKLIEITLYSVN